MKNLLIMFLLIAGINCSNSSHRCVTITDAGLVTVACNDGTVVDVIEPESGTVTVPVEVELDDVRCASNITTDVITVVCDDETILTIDLDVPATPPIFECVKRHKKKKYKCLKHRHH